MTGHQEVALFVLADYFDQFITLSDFDVDSTLPFWIEPGSFDTVHYYSQKSCSYYSPTRGLVSETGLQTLEFLFAELGSVISAITSVAAIRVQKNRDLQTQLRRIKSDRANKSSETNRVEQSVNTVDFNSVFCVGI